MQFRPEKDYYHALLGPELTFGVQVTPLPRTRGERKDLPMKRQFLQAALKSFGYRATDLPVGATLRYQVDLTKWFEFTGPGFYEVRVCYWPVVEIAARR